MKVFIDTDVGSYTFAPGAAGVGTVTITGVSSLQLEQVLSIMNVTTNEFIYLPPDANLGGSIASNVLTLDVDTSAMNANDRLQILVDLPVTDLPSIPVSLPPPTPPAGTTPQSVTEFNDVSGNSADYDYFTIPNGETITVQKLQGSSEGDTKETYVALWHDPNGDTASGAQDDGHPNWELIALGFTNISNINFDLNNKYVGDGTARVVLHRRRMDSGARLVFARWQGFTE